MTSNKKDLLEKCKELGITCSKSLSKEKIIELISQKEKSKTVIIENKRGTKVKFIYHLADIHIRYLERHQEYKEVFNKLYETIKSDSDRESSILVISGDLFHNRDRFVSETIILFNDFIKQLSELVEMFVIVGNHDCFNHCDRLDTISGIASIKEYERFHLLKNSGTYKFSNISFGVSSLLDCLGVPLPVKEESTTNIALYHGIISGSVLDNGTSASEGLSVSSFNGYDITLLGDIHRRQFLNKEKTIAYPGSLIQQNFKEELDHGYLKWDINTKTSTFVKIENDYCFMDIPVNGTIDLSSINFTKKSRIRLLVDNITTEEQINETIEKCKEYTEVIGIKKIIKDSNILSKINNNTNLLETVDQSEINIIKNNVKEEYISEILDLHESLLKDIDYEDTFTKSLPWTIEKIEFRNIFSYGDDILNCINLKDGISGILADNASGKTNILNTIIYGLFGLSRTQNHLNKNIISRFSKKEDLLVRLSITMTNGERYFIERTAKNKTRSRIKSSEAGQLDVLETLKFYNDDKNLNLGTKPETEKLIKDTLSILGKEEFILTNMMSNISYGSNMSIISMNGTQLDEVFNNIFNLNKYKNLHKDSKTKAKEYLEELKNLRIKLELTDKDLKNYDYFILENKIKNLKESTSKNYSNLKTDKLKLQTIENQLLKLQKTDITSDENMLKLELKIIQKKLKDYPGSIKELLEMEDQLELEYDSLIKNYNKSDTFNENPKEIIQESIVEIQNLISFNEGNRRTVNFDSNITNEYLKAKKYISGISNDSTLDISKISETISNLQYDKKLSHYIVPSKTREKLLADLTKTYIDPNLLLKYRKVIEEKEAIEQTISDNIVIDQKINSLKKKLKNKKIQIAHETKKRLLEINDLLDYIELYNDSIRIEKDLKVLNENKEVNTLITEKTKFSISIENLLSNIKSQELELELSTRDLNQYNELSKVRNAILPKIKTLTYTLEVYKIYIDLTHQKNLPKFLISKVIKNITTEANELIYNTTGLLCEIQENEKWEIVIRKGSLILGPEHCSGYERFLINTALKIAFDKYKQLSSIKLFMIDETIDCVSESNFEQIDVLLDYLHRHYKKVILISHNEDLKKKVNHRIELCIENNCSRII